MYLNYRDDAKRGASNCVCCSGYFSCVVSPVAVQHWGHFSVNTRLGNPKVRTQDSGLTVTMSGPNLSD